jgi:regulatory protein
MYTIEEFDKQKTKVFKYIMFKKRTEAEIRTKFKIQIEEDMLDDIIEYLKEAGYINDYNFIEKQVKEYMSLKNMSIQEIKYKLMTKGLDKKLIEKYIEENIEELEQYERKSAENIKTKKSSQIDEQEIKQYLYKKGYKV